MMRTTGIMQNNSLVRNLERHKYEMDKVQNQLATGQRISRPGDDPSAATNQMYYRSRVNELDQFAQNIEAAIEQSNVFASIVSFEGALQQLASDPVDPSLRAAVVEDFGGSEPTIVVTVDGRQFARMCGGRPTIPDAPQTIEYDGDIEAGNRIVKNLTFVI